MPRRWGLEQIHLTPCLKVGPTKNFSLFKVTNLILQQGSLEPKFIICGNCDNKKGKLYLDKGDLTLNALYTDRLACNSIIV